jgi:hypothetical protein
MLGANPFLIGSRPLLRGKKAPPQPPIDPQKMGPNTGKLKLLAGIVAPAAFVNVTTTPALIISYMTIMNTYI